MESQNLLMSLIHTLYVTYDHNQLVFAYFIGFIFCAVLAIWKPNRFSILLLLSFAVLGFGYEYDKHLVGPLTRQTLQSILEKPDEHVRIQRIINTFLGEIVPILLYVAGWGLMFIGIFLGVQEYQPAVKSQSKTSEKTTVIEE